MTDNEMIKYLRDHGLTNGCSLGHHSGTNDLIADRMVALIEENNRQKAEIENYSHNNKNLTEAIMKLQIELKAMRGAANSYKAEVESITEKFNCQQTVYADLSEIIKDKNAEIERLRESKEQLEVSGSETIHGLCAEIRTLKKTNDSYKEECNKILNLIPKARAEAVKEFAERLKKLSRNLYPFSDEPIIDCKDIDNLVKEMVGDAE